MSIPVPVPGKVPHHAIERTRRFQVTAIIPDPDVPAAEYALVLDREVVVYAEDNTIIEIKPHRTITLPHSVFTNTPQFAALMPVIAPELDAIAVAYP
jgi:hypothetical protein